MGKLTINGDFPVVMLNYQRVTPKKDKTRSPSITIVKSYLFAGCYIPKRQTVYIFKGPLKRAAIAVPVIRGTSTYNAICPSYKVVLFTIGLPETTELFSIFFPTAVFHMLTSSCKIFFPPWGTHLGRRRRQGKTWGWCRVPSSESESWMTMTFP